MPDLLLIYATETDPAEVPPERRAQITAMYGAFTREVRERDAIQGDEALQPTTTATTVRDRDGQALEVT
jgi:hypothetical protein